MSNDKFNQIINDINKSSKLVEENIKKIKLLLELLKKEY